MVRYQNVREHDSNAGIMSSLEGLLSFADNICEQFAHRSGSK